MPTTLPSTCSSPRAARRGRGVIRSLLFAPAGLIRSLLFASAGLALTAPVASSAVPKRIIALTPYSANTMTLLGVKPIAVGQVSSGEGSVYSAALNTVPRLPLSHPSGPNLEQLTTLKADFVFSSQAWARGKKGMERIGLRVAEREPRTVSEVPRQTKRIASILGRSAQGAKLAKAQEAQIKAATKGIKKHPKVLVVLGVGNSPYAFLENSWGGDVVKRAGGTLITAGLKASGGFARISDEAVVARNPDVIIAVPHGAPGDIKKIAAQMRDRPGWRTTNAARTRRIYVSTSNTLLQPISGAGTTIAGVRKILGN
ncbi:MAG: ABC transporter substrate-binding protein [Solirubrobacteraceae bacterium]|nr:ABC transporter substrate-binding protein [Solirubrobacteraceae bacterium]